MSHILKPKKVITFICCIAIHFISFSQGKIIMNGATMNVVNSAYVVTTDVSSANTGAVNINNSTIKVSGSINNGSTLNVTNGTVEMNGLSSQIIPANAFYTNKIKNLIISNNVTLAGQDSLTGILSFGAVDSKTFTTGGFLTLKSTADGTANVADLTNDDTNTGNQVLDSVIVERYISAVKKWRFLSIPTNTSQTIKAAWQEGSLAPNDNLIPGFGTQITGAGGVPAGFDVYTATPSMKTYNATTATWITVPNTNTALINHPVNNTVSYFVFVRGNRSATLFTSPVSATVLRTKGVIKQGDQPAITIASPATAFTAVGNPYPSRIDLRRMTPAPTTATKIYVWDPIATAGSTNGLGAYQTLTFDGSDFTVTPGGGNYAPPYNRNPDYLESGDAFLAGGNSSPYNISFKEDIKPSGNNLISFTAGIRQSLKASLYTNINGAVVLMDGIKADIGSNFSSYLDNDDAFKVFNSSENVSLQRNGQLLSVERHDIITVQDTFFLTIGNMNVKSYQWRLNLKNLDQPGLSGFLEDHYLNTSLPLDLNGSTIANFNVVSNPASYAPGRFRIVFRQLSTLAVTLTSVKAYQRDKDIAVEWKAENESNMKKYAVEKSADGNHYFAATSVLARNAVLSHYYWLDVNPSVGYNYYRVLATDLNGKTGYSAVVKVLIGEGAQSISIYPNPVENGTINLQLTNVPAGEYGLRLLNEMGQVMMSKQINHAQGSNIEKIQLDKYSAHGIYQLEITRPDGNKVNMNVIY